MRNPTNGQISWIVEVETSDPGKSVVGAAILAAICMEIDMERGRQQGRPNLLFVFYRPSANLQLAEKKLKELAHHNRVSFLGEILSLTEKQALEKIRNVSS